MCFVFFYFIKISKFALTGVMLIYERTSKDRKKERNRTEASSIMRVLSSARYTVARLYTIRIKIGTNCDVVKRSRRQPLLELLLLY